jgi:hypothetical protein
MVPSTDRARVVAARLYRRIGWPGMVGMMALCVAIAILVQARPAKHLNVSLPPSTTQAVSRGAPALPKLSSTAEIPLIEAQIEQAAVTQGLGWAQAQYRLNPSGDETFGSVEVRCTLKGPYPNLRRFVAQVLTEVPGASLRELAMSRASSDTPEVEGKFDIVVFLRDPAQAVKQGGRP